jgi:hypothetical protein
MYQVCKSTSNLCLPKSLVYVIVLFSKIAVTPPKCDHQTTQSFLFYKAYLEIRSVDDDTTINEIDKNIGCKLRRHQMHMTVYDENSFKAVNPTNDGDRSKRQSSKVQSGHVDWVGELVSLSHLTVMSSGYVDRPKMVEI